MGIRFFSLLVVILGLACAPASVSAEETVYRFGIVPQYAPRELANIWLPILSELEQRTGLKFLMQGSAKIPDFEVSFLSGEFDFAYMNPYHALLAGESPGYIPLVRDGGRKLSGILVVPKDSTIQNITELEGQKVAFPSPNALASALLMRAELETTHGVKVTPLYVQNHSSVYLNVILGKTAAGGGVLSTLKAQNLKIQDEIRIIYTTQKIHPHPITAHPRVPQEHRNAVRQAFLDMAGTEQGSALLQKIPIKSAIPASLEDYQVLKELGLESFYVR